MALPIIADVVTAGDWPKLIVSYGPAALLVFVVSVVVPLFWPKSKQPSTVGRVASWLTLLSIFALAALIVVAWWKVQFPTEYVVTGTITGLMDPERIETDQDLYLRLLPLEGVRFEYQWRLITPQRYTGSVMISLQKPPAPRCGQARGGEGCVARVLEFEIPFNRDFSQGV